MSSRFLLRGLQVRVLLGSPGFRSTYQEIGAVSASFFEPNRVARRSDPLAGNSRRYAPPPKAPRNTDATCPFAFRSRGASLDLSLDWSRLRSQGCLRRWPRYIATIPESN